MMKTKLTPEWVDLETARQIEGSPTTYQFSRWLTTWNNNPETANKVRRRFARVEKASLVAALNEDEERFSRGGRARRPAKLSQTERRANP